MRTLTSATATQAARPTGSYPIRILQIDLPSAYTIYLSDRTVAPTPGVETLPVVKTWGDLRLEPEIGQVGGFGSFTCTVSDLDWLLFDAESEQPGIQFVRCTLYLWFNDTDWADRVTLFSGTMAPQDFQINKEEVSLTIRGLEELWNKNIGFRITQNTFPTIKCSECDGTVLPLIFGRPAYRIPLCPIVQPARSMLNLPVSICDSMLQIVEDADLLGFPIGEAYPTQLVIGVDGDYDIFDGWFDDVDKRIFHITDRLSYHAHAETAGIYVSGGLTWVTIDKADLDDAGDKDMRGYPIIFPQRMPSGQATCVMSAVQFWDETPDATELAVWPDNRNEFPTSDDDGEEYIILNRISIPFYPAGTAVVEQGEWVWAANFLPSEAIDRVEVKGTLRNPPLGARSNVVFYTVNPYIYEVQLNNQDYNESHLGREADDNGLTTITMQTSPIQNGFQDDIMYVTIRGVAHMTGDEHNPLFASLVDGEAIENPAAVIAEIASNPFLGNISDFQVAELQDAFDQAPIVFGFGITKQTGLWDIIGQLAKQAGLLVYVDGGKLVVRRVLVTLPSPADWTSSNQNRHKASLTCKPRDAKEMPLEIIGRYRASGGDDEQRIVRRAVSNLALVARLTSSEMDFWAIQLPSNVAYMTEWWLIHELSRSRRFTFEQFMEYLAAQPGDMIELTHDVVNDVPEVERRIDTAGRIVSITHMAGSANSRKMELIRVEIECHEWSVDLYQGAEPYECGVLRTTVDAPPPTVYTWEPDGDVPGNTPNFPAQVLTPGNGDTIISGGGTTIHFGITDEAIDKNATGTVSRYTAGSLSTDSGTNDEVTAWLEDIQSGARVVYVEYATGEFVAIRAEC